MKKHKKYNLLPYMVGKAFFKMLLLKKHNKGRLNKRMTKEKIRNWTKEEVTKKEKAAFEVFNDKRLWKVLFALLGVSIFVDFLPMYRIAILLSNITHCDIVILYDHAIKLFDYDVGVFVPILMVVWAFVVGFSSIFFDKMESKCFGIRVLDIIEHKGLLKELYQIVVVAVLELVLILVGAFFEWKLTLCVLSILLLVTMMVVFLFVVVYFSRAVVIELVLEEIDLLQTKTNLSECILFDKLLNNIDYGSKEEVDMLKSVLDKIAAFSRSGQIDGTYSEEDINNKKIAYSITSEMLDNIGNSVERKRVIEYWFNKTSSSAMKVGILYALLDRETKEDFDYAISLLRHLSEEYCRKLCILIALYEMKYGAYYKSKWRMKNAENIYRQYLQTMLNHEVELWHLLWQKVCTNKVLWRYSYEFLDKMNFKREYK